MPAIRQLLAHRRVTLLICAATLLLKLLIPTGYMIGTDHGRIAVTVCSGTGPATMMVDMPVMHGDVIDHGAPKDHSKVEMPCAFAGMSAAMLGAVDPFQLAALLVFILALGLMATVPPAPLRPPHLRPPSRGPPAYR